MANTKKILLVDDDIDFRFQQKSMLEAAGLSVTEAASGVETIEILENFRPDLAMVDVMMEEHDSGFTLCQKIKRQYPDLPNIMVTGVGAETGISFEAKTNEENRWIRADVLLSKPVRYEQLQQTIDRLLKDKD